MDCDTTAICSSCLIILRSKADREVRPFKGPNEMFFNSCPLCVMVDFNVSRCGGAITAIEHRMYEEQPKGRCLKIVFWIGDAFSLARRLYMTAARGRSDWSDVLASATDTSSRHHGAAALDIMTTTQHTISRSHCIYQGAGARLSRAAPPLSTS